MRKDDIPEIKTFIRVLPKNRVLSLRFNCHRQDYTCICCPCSKLMSGWYKSNYISTMPMFMGETQCNNKLNDPEWIIIHLTTKSYQSPYHHGSLRYIQILYCNAKIILRPCVSQASSATASNITTITQKIISHYPPTDPTVRGVPHY